MCRRTLKHLTHNTLKRVIRCLGNLDKSEQADLYLESIIKELHNLLERDFSSDAWTKATKDLSSHQEKYLQSLGLAPMPKQEIIDTGEMMTYKRNCPKCNAEQTVEVSVYSYAKWQTGGVLIQKAMSKLNADEREVFLSGLCPPCWETQHGED